MFLLSKHHRVVEVENDTPVHPLQQTKFEFIETDSLEQNNDVVPRRFFQNPESVGQTGSPRGQHRSFDPKLSVVLQAVPQPQPGAGSVTVFDDAKGLHDCSLTIYNFFECRSRG